MQAKRSFRLGPIRRGQNPLAILFSIIVLGGLLLVGCNGGDKRVATAKGENTSKSAPIEAPPENPPASKSRTPDPESEKKTHGIKLTEVTKESGIAFVHFYDGKGERYIIESNAAGMASFDFDLDGNADLYFVNGDSIPIDENERSLNALYRNTGSFRFVDVSNQSGCDLDDFGMGALSADYDNDGFPDLFLSNFGPNRLLHNNGDGTFSDATELAGVGGGEHLGAGSTFFDADRDGDLDLYVGNYVLDPVKSNIKRTTDGFPSYPGPLDFQPAPDIYFRNEGDGTFVDATDASGFGGVASTTMGVIAADFDGDGDEDLTTMNDVDRNFYFRNDGTGHFQEMGVLAGIAFAFDGRRNGNMGIDIGDYNNDGTLDVYTTTFSNENPVLYKNDGLGNFEDVTLRTGANGGLFPHANWGLAFCDLENDGDLELFIGNGHTDPLVSSWAYTTSWKVANTLLLNLGNGRFTDVSESAGSGLKPVESSRGVVVEDFDNDGDVDLVVGNALAAPNVLRNESNPRGNWIQLELHGTSSSRDGTGAFVMVEAGGKKYVSQVVSGRGYQGSFGNRLHFGLGKGEKIDRIQVRWSVGPPQTLDAVEVNQLLRIVQP